MRREQETSGRKEVTVLKTGVLSTIYQSTLGGAGLGSGIALTALTSGEARDLGIAASVIAGVGLVSLVRTKIGEDHARAKEIYQSGYEDGKTGRIVDWQEQNPKYTIEEFSSNTYKE